MADSLRRHGVATLSSRRLLRGNEGLAFEGVSPAVLIVFASNRGAMEFAESREGGKRSSAITYSSALFSEGSKFLVCDHTLRNDW